MDLNRHFETLAGPEVIPTMDDVDADLHRGRRALRKRRSIQQVAGGAFAVAALAAGIAVAGDNVPATTVPGTAQSQGQIATRLVAYTGSQPKGYTIDTVPAGWQIQADDQYALVLAPKDARDKDPHSFVGKITVMVQSADEKGAPQGKSVKVGHSDGILVTGEQATDPATPPLRDQDKPEAVTKGSPTNGGLQIADDAKGAPSMAPLPAENGIGDGASLWIKQPSGVYLTVQFWDGLGLSEQDMLTIGAGIHVHKDAEQSHG